MILIFLSLQAQFHLQWLPWEAQGPQPQVCEAPGL